MLCAPVRLHDFPRGPRLKAPRKGLTIVRRDLLRRQAELRHRPVRNAAAVYPVLHGARLRPGREVEHEIAGILADCAGGIDSLVELLQGKLSTAVMERLCRQDAGLFPKPSEIRFSCTCPDFASMCKHVAAALYGVGVRLDRKPELLFRLCAVNETELVANIDVALPISRTETASDKILEGGDLSAMFGLEMATPPAIEQAVDDAGPPGSRRVASAPKRSPPAVKAAASRKRGSPGIDAAAGRSRAARPNQLQHHKKSGSAQPKA